jgi:hypothetical protein
MVLLLLGISLGCKPEKIFPPEPIITFKSLEQFEDSTALTVGFTDGDGDLGLLAGEEGFNFFLQYYSYTNGVWTLVDLPPIGDSYGIPELTPSGQDKVLVGELTIALEWPLVAGFGEGDTVRIDMYMTDRAQNVSNTVSTGQVSVRR